MNNSNFINTPLHVVNFVASLSNFANDRNLTLKAFRSAEPLSHRRCVSRSVLATPADGFILGVSREINPTKFVVNNWFMAASLLTKQSGQKPKSCVRLKDCINIIYGTIIWILSRPFTSS